MVCVSDVAKGVLMAGTVLFSGMAVGDPPDVRHGSVPDGRQVLSFEGGLVMTWQHAGAVRAANDELLASLDLVATLPKGNGVWTLYVEGDVTPSPAGSSTLDPVVNADAGTALDGEGAGRLQVSGLHYSHPVGEGSVTFGLLDPARFLDASEVANDETRQFLAAALVNNPTIGLPDYTLGAAYHYDAEQWSPGITLLFADGAGLAGGKGSYAELFSLQGGLFSALELYWQPAPLTMRLGGWHRTLPMSGTNGGERRGFYALAEGELEGLRWNLRGGIAGGVEVQTDSYVAVATALPFGDVTVGAGWAYLDRKGGTPVEQVECYVRADVGEALQLTADLQWLEQAEREGEVFRGLTVTGFRLAFLF